MANLARIVKGLRLERARAATEVERLDKAIAVLGSRSVAGLKRRKRTMSLAARRRIAAAQRARWAKWKEKRQKKAA